MGTDEPRTDAAATVLSTVVDKALEATVAGSWSRVGYEVRRRLPGWDDLDDAPARRGGRGAHRVHLRASARPRRTASGGWAPGSTWWAGTR